MRNFISRHRFGTSMFWRYFFLLILVEGLFLATLTMDTHQSARSLQEAYLEQAEQAFYNDCAAFSEDLLRTHDLLSALEEFKFYSQANQAAAPLDRYEKYYLLQMGETVSRQCTMFGLPGERFLYFSRAGAVDTPNRFFLDAADCFATQLIYREEASFTERLDLLLNEYAVNALTVLPAGSVSIRGGEEEPYLTILLLAVRQKQVFGFLYSVDEVLEQFSLNALPERTSLRLVDRNGEELFSAGGTPEETDCIEFSAPLSAVSCTAVIGIPRSYFDGLTRDAQRVSRVIFLFSLVVGVALCFLFSHISIHPFRRLIRDHVADQSVDIPVNELEAIDTFLISAREKNAALGQMLLSSLLVRAYYGLTIPEGEKKTVSAAMPIFGQPLYAAIVRDLGGKRDAEDSGSMAALLGRLPEPFLCEYVSLQEGILLFRAESGQLDRLHGILMQLNGEVREQPQFVCGVSAPFTGLEGISDAMRQAQFCVPEEGERTLALFTDNSAAPREAEADFDVRRFQQALTCWSRKELLAQINQCAAGAGTEDAGDAEEAFYTALHLLRSAARMGQLSFAHHEGLGYRATSSPAVNLRRLRGVVDDLFAQREELLAAESDRLGRELVRYINANLSDTGLCLASLVKQFGVSERFVHSAVHAHSGVNLTQYLIQMRMEEAARLLRETDESINSIALRCGCAAPSTFFRNFKKYYGVSPSEYRNSGE